jgi:ABC-type multidrug transport system permease subunit
MIVSAFIAAALKDAQLLLRDRGAIASLFALPIVFIAVFGMMFQEGEGGEPEPRDLPIFYAHDHEAGAAVARSLEQLGMFRPQLFPDADAVRASVARGEALAGLVIPPDFEPMRGRPAELVIDESESAQVVAPLRGAVTAAVARAVFGDLGSLALVELRSPPGVREPGVALTGFQVAVPGNAVLFGFFLALTMALSFVEERDSGTWRRLLAAPLPRRVILLAKLAPYLVVGMVQMALLFGVGALAFGMQVAGSLAGLFALTVAVVFCAVALGLFLASFGGTSKQLGGVGSIALLVMGLLGGAMIPRLVMPPSMQTLGLATPHGWALDGYYDVLVRADTTLFDLAPSIAAVMAFGIFFALVGVLRFRFER